MDPDSKVESEVHAAERENASNGSDLEARTVDPAAEKALLRKLDIRIVPMMMLLYLMSFMDRGILIVFLLKPWI